MLSNFLELTDGYKLDHRRQYVPGTEYVMSNLTPRSTRDERYKGCVFLMLQGFLQEFLMENAQQTFFSRPKAKVCAEYQDLLNEYFGPNDIGVSHIAELHDLGYIPLEFRALPEGTLVPLRVPMFTYENTHPRFFWLTNYFETLLSSVVWKACRNATVALEYRKVFEKYARLTGADFSFVNWQGHDFSFRGMSGPEDAVRAGTGHLASFLGSDTFPAIRYLKRYYDATGIIAGSIPATEHSVMCAGGQEDEIETISRILSLYPTGPLSQVSDTWDLWKVIDQYLPILKPQIMARDGKLVVRPDSGDPANILCGDPAYALGTIQRKGVITALWDIFLGSTNQAGFMNLDSHIGSVYGDSITLLRQDDILNRLYHMGFASTNVVLGIGSYTYQYTTRDDFGMAVKATWTMRTGEERLMQKDPVTDKSGKKSAKGRLAVIQNDNGELKLVDGLTREEHAKMQSIDLLQTVWKDGSFYQRHNWGEIRTRLAGYR